MALSWILEVIRANYLISMKSKMDTQIRYSLAWQEAPDLERKFIVVLSGRVIDFTIDLNAESPNFQTIHKFELSANGNVLEIPPMFAHGYLTLEPNSTLLYIIQGKYEPSRQRGLRWNDPHFNLQLPFIPQLISERDSTFPDFECKK
jgi:dTDP-4-dehydrorhamnose 3,5-epimerase